MIIVGQDRGARQERRGQLSVFNFELLNQRQRTRKNGHTLCPCPRKFCIMIIMVASADSATIFRRVIDPERGTMSPELARFVLDLDFPAEDHARFEELSDKAQTGALSAEEARELDNYLHVDNLLTILRLKAERSLDNTDSSR
jgi:hypothetical protein